MNRMTSRCLLLFSVASTSCVSTSKLAVSGSAGLIPFSEEALKSETSWEAFRRGGPSGLQMLEALHRADPSRVDILAAMARGYSGYAALVAETELLEDQLADRKDTSAKHLAIEYHTRAVHYARLALLGAGLQRGDGIGVTDAFKHVEKSQETVDVAFVMAQSMKALVGLHREQPAFLKFLPASDDVTHWACNGASHPSFPTWGCDVMAAVELAEKPAVIGGNPAAARKSLEAVISKNPDELFLSALLAQFVLAKKPDAAAWDQIKKQYAKVKQQETERAADVLSGKQRKEDSNGLANAAALERLRIMIKYERDLF